MNFLNRPRLKQLNLVIFSAQAWPKGEETYSVTPSFISGVPFPILILMGLVLVGMLVIWWKSRRDKK